MKAAACTRSEPRLLSGSAERMKALASHKCRLAPAVVLVVLATMIIAFLRLSTLSPQGSKICFSAATWQSTSLFQGSATPGSDRGADSSGWLSPAPQISLHQAYHERMKAVNVDSFRPNTTAGAGHSSRFLANNNILKFPILAVENVCILPDETLLLLDMSAAELLGNLTADEELYYLWNDLYGACGNQSTDTCTGVQHASGGLPEHHSWIPGNTLHFVAYVGNAMHNWAERTWPHLAGFVAPLNATTPKPVHHFLVHRFSKWLQESERIDSRKQLLWQARMLMELAPGSDYLLLHNQTRPACFERLLLQMHDRDRIDQTRLPPEIYKPAIQNFRASVFRFFGYDPPPPIPLPPTPLRVLYYGRHDTTRRMVTNSEEVLGFLGNMSRPKLAVHSLDDMMASGLTSYDFPDVFSVFSQTDILVIAHGANTWATFCLPEGAGVVEIFGPCNWSGYNHSDLSVMHTWMHVNAGALELKHDTSNPFLEAMPNPRRGNTTLCLDPYAGVPDYSIDTIKLGQIIHSFGYPDHPGDRLTYHWLHDWDS